MKISSLILLLLTLLMCSCLDSDSSAPLVTSNGVEIKRKDHFPAFSWDTVPLYAMFADGERLLKPEEVNKIQQDTGFICIEKNHGKAKLGDALLGLKHENTAFKALNPNTKVIGYFNGAIAYPFTRYTENMSLRKIEKHPKLKSYLLDATEEDLEKRPFHRYNVLNPEMRAWWADSCADLIAQSGADGIFIDQVHGNPWAHPKEKRADCTAGVVDMMRQLKEKMGEEKILLANNAAHIDPLFEIADAFMFEHYKQEVTHTKEQLLRDWALMEKIADAGKLCVYRFGVEIEDKSASKDSTDSKHKKRSDSEYEKLSKEKAELYLAIYLIGAQPYSYFQWGWGWKLSTGPLVEYPEFSKPLGAPLGKYHRPDQKKWVFTREFEHASVWLDTEKWEAKITWNK